MQLTARSRSGSRTCVERRRTRHASHSPRRSLRMCRNPARGRHHNPNQQRCHRRRHCRQQRQRKHDRAACASTRRHLRVCVRCGVCRAVVNRFCSTAGEARGSKPPRLFLRAPRRCCPTVVAERSAEDLRLARPKASTADRSKNPAVNAHLEPAARGPRRIAHEAERNAGSLAVDRHHRRAIVPRGR